MTNNVILEKRAGYIRPLQSGFAEPFVGIRHTVSAIEHGTISQYITYTDQPKQPALYLDANPLTPMVA